jgi:hypothetical protein
VKKEKKEGRILAYSLQVLPSLYLLDQKDRQAYKGTATLCVMQCLSFIVLLEVHITDTRLSARTLQIQRVNNQLRTFVPDPPFRDLSA